MEAGSGVSAPVISESLLARLLTFRSWQKLVSESTKLLAFKKFIQRTQATFSFGGTDQRSWNTFRSRCFQTQQLSGKENSLAKCLLTSLRMGSEKAWGRDYVEILCERKTIDYPASLGFSLPSISWTSRRVVGKWSHCQTGLVHMSSCVWYGDLGEQTAAVCNWSFSNS